MRKAQEDVLARSEAERVVGDEMEAVGLIGGDTLPAEAGRLLLNRVAKAVEFEHGTSKDPDKNTVPMRRLVITGPWVVNPDGLPVK